MAPRAVQIWFQNKRKALNVRRNNKRKDLLINTKDLSGSSSSYQTPLNSPSTLQPTIKNILNE
ncbi:hypothetical protein K502DRAFT_323835 [Neoconidiobolus thromboides FSU 785]|nr:hypothetical protein K502DRAFT_323835 [Neoconidiobolus thromboides FSU 785]